MDTKLKLGDVARDSVSGFEGVCVAKTEWLYGCVRFGLSPRMTHEGKLIEDQWFDEARLVPAVDTSGYGLAPAPQKTDAALGSGDPAPAVAPGGPSRERKTREG